MNTKLLQTLVAAASFSLCLGAVNAFAAQPAPAKHESSSKMWSEPYMKVGAGLTWYNQFKAKSDSSVPLNVYTKKAPSKAPSFHFGVGCAISGDFKTDLMLRYSELQYKASNDKQKMTAFDIMANAYYDINVHKTVVPYVSAGFGIARVNAGTLSHSIPTPPNVKINQQGAVTTNFAWNAGVGVKFNFAKDYAIDLGYRYVDLGKAKVNAVVNNIVTMASSPSASQQLRGHQGLISLIYKF